MLNLSTENKDLCFKDSTQKPLYIFLYYWKELENADENSRTGYWQYFKTIDEAIVLESMGIDEGILDGNTFELGSFIVPTLKVKWQNDGIRYKDMVAVPVQKIGTEYVAYFDGYISSEEIEEDGRTVSAEIVSFLGERLNIDVLDTIKSYSGSTFYEMVQNALGQTADIWIKGSETDELLKKFSNANTIITLNQNTLPKTLTAGELLKQSGEFLGGHIILREKRLVDFEEMKNYNPQVTPTIEFMTLSNVDIVSKCEIENLPKEYKRLEYIEGSGTQYIITDIYPDDTTIFEVKFSILKDTGGAIVGWYTNNETDAFRFYSLNGLAYLDYGSGWSSSSGGNKIYGGNFNKGIIYDLEFGNRYIKNLDTDEIVVSDATVSFDKKTYPISIFGNRGSFSGKIYGCKIIQSYNLVADFVPCIRISDNSAGLYDLISQKFYGNSGTGEFLTPSPINIYQLPYYISSFTDKTQNLKIGSLNVLTESGTQKQYTSYWGEDVTNTFQNMYEIRDNIFFEALSTKSADDCWLAIEKIKPYISNQYMYRTELKTVYPPFIEGGDYLIVKPKSELPSDYIELSSITLGDFITDIVPDGSYFEFDIEFEAIENGLNMIFESGDIGYQNTVRLYTSSEDSLIFEMGYYGESIPFGSGFEIEHYPKNQKIKLNIKRGNNKCIYSGTFNGVTEYSGFGDEFTGANPIGFYPCKFYHFAYSQDGVKICDLKPCIRKSDKAIGVYNTVNGEFIEAYGMGNSPQYETLGTVIPVLSSNANGIHSMKADIVCKATNTNKK